jgi:hypothetical protein
MADVGVWQPDSVGLDATTVVRLIDAAQHLDDATFGLSAQEVAQFAFVMQRPAADWRPLLRDVADARLVQLTKFFTLAELRLAGWEALSRSPVIPIVAELRRRRTYPDDLTAWIKANTTNRFLPYGSLLDRL